MGNAEQAQPTMAAVSLTRYGPGAEGHFEFPWAQGPLEAHLISDVGKKRERNEDACVLCAPESPWLARERGLLVAVADGMGGAQAGERASRLTLSEIVKHYYAGADVLTIPAQIQDAIERANGQVFHEAIEHPELHGMGTTASVVIVRDDVAYIAQVGDSRVYIAREGQPLYRITEDHSIVAEQVRNGIISEDEARHHNLKNLITRAVGIKEMVDVDLFGLRLKRGDTVLVCSDGLSNAVDDTTINQALRLETIQGAARLLVGQALEAGGSDNISVAVLRVRETLPHGNMHRGCVSVSLPGNGFLGKLRRLVT